MRAARFIRRIRSCGVGRIEVGVLGCGLGGRPVPRHVCVHCGSSLEDMILPTPGIPEGRLDLKMESAETPDWFVMTSCPL